MGYQVGVGRKAGNHNFAPLLPKFPTQPPDENEYRSLKGFPSGTPSQASLGLATVRPGPGALRLIVPTLPTSPPARLPEVRAPQGRGARSSWVRGGRSPPLSCNHRPLPTTLALPANLLSLKRNQRVPRRRPGGCCPNAGRRRTGAGRVGRSESLRPALGCSLRPTAPQRDAGSTGPARPRFLPPDREPLGGGHLPALDAGAEQPLALLVSRSRRRRARPRAGCRSHHMLLTPTVSVPAVLGHGGQGTGGGGALSRRSLFPRPQVAGGGRLCACAGRSSLRL